jgi:hypothetical protein
MDVETRKITPTGMFEDNRSSGHNSGARCCCCSHNSEGIHKESNQGNNFNTFARPRRHSSYDRHLAKPGSRSQMPCHATAFFRVRPISFYNTSRKTLCLRSYSFSSLDETHPRGPELFHSQLYLIDSGL